MDDTIIIENESSTLQEAGPAASGSSGPEDVLLCLQMIFVVLVVWFIMWVCRGIRSLFSRIGGR